MSSAVYTGMGLYNEFMDRVLRAGHQTTPLTLAINVVNASSHQNGT